MAEGSLVRMTLCQENWPFIFCRLRAAHSAWGQSLREYMCVDSSAAMLDLAEKLLKGEKKV